MLNKHKRKKSNKRNISNNEVKNLDQKEKNVQEECKKLGVEEAEINSEDDTLINEDRIYNKRSHIDDDSDMEEKPKKKKKKNHLQPVGTSDKKGKKSIRQIKREKLAERRAETEAVSKEQLKSQCLSYLSQWKHDKQNWKFMKAKQVWLYKNKFSSQLIPETSWPLFIEYFECAKGNIRNMLLVDANKIIKQMDEWSESQNKKDNNENDEEDDTETSTNSKPDETSYRRARDIIQCLQE